MLTKEENERLSRVGPDTPMGNLLRRYWYPVSCSTLLDSKPQRVTLLGEELVLYRGESGKPVLMQLRCAHRNVALDYGRVEGDAIRCPYHGWLYGSNGQCLAQPCDPESDSSKPQFALKAYTTQEVSGLIFAYMGPDPAPLLPMYDLLREHSGIKQIRMSNIGASVLQDMENILDVTHFSWLHGYTFPQFGAKNIIAGIEPTEYGLEITLGAEGVPAEKSPYLFPVTNRFPLPAPGTETGLIQVLLYRVPVDDYSHLIYALAWIKDSAVPADPNRPVPAVRFETKIGEYAPLAGDWWGIDINDQDRMAMEQQGAISDRTREHLVASDIGIVRLRRLLRDAMEAVEKGEEAPYVIRDPAKQNIDFPYELGVSKPPAQDKIDYALGLFDDVQREPA